MVNDLSADDVVLGDEEEEVEPKDEELELEDEEGDDLLDLGLLDEEEI